MVCERAGTLSRLQGTPLKIATGAAVAAAFIGFMLTSQFPGGGRFSPEDIRGRFPRAIGQEILAALPADASLATTNRLGVHAVTRREIYLYPWIPTTASPEYFLLDANEPEPYPYRRMNWKHPLLVLWLRRGVETVREEDGYFLFRGTTDLRLTPRDRGFGNLICG